MTFQSLYLCIQMVATLHLDGCHFAPRWLPLCTLIVAFLHSFLRWSFWKPKFQHFSFSY